MAQKGKHSGALSTLDPSVHFIDSSLVVLTFLGLE